MRTPPYMGPLGVPKDQAPLAEMAEMTPAQLQAYRIKRIGERANALRRAGYYPKEDIEMMATWVTNGAYGLVEIEAILWHAEQDYQELHTERPCQPATPTSSPPSRRSTD